LKRLLQISGEVLAKGLRPSKRIARNRSFLTTCNGFVGNDGILSAIDDLSAIDVTPSEVTGTDSNIYTCIDNHSSTNDDKPITGANYALKWTQAGSIGGVWEVSTAYKDGITDGFPYPQMFLFTNRTIICGETGIFEWDGSTLDRKLTVAAGGTWDAVDFVDYVYMSNSKVAVIRNAKTGIYSTTTDLPIFSGVVNYNGRVLITAPGVEV
jgi:hypothetical protein